MLDAYHQDLDAGARLGILSTYLGHDALLAAPNLSAWTGRRDPAMIVLAAQTGLCASELTNVRIADLTLGTGADQG
jgi:integrase